MTPSRPQRTTSLRTIGMPRILEVRVDGVGEPVAVTRTDVRGRQGEWLRVDAIEEEWKLAEAWWRQSAQARTYYRLRLAGDRLLTLFHDDITGAWFEQPYSAPEVGRR